MIAPGEDVDSLRCRASCGIENVIDGEDRVRRCKCDWFATSCRKCEDREGYATEEGCQTKRGPEFQDGQGSRQAEGKIARGKTELYQRISQDCDCEQDRRDATRDQGRGCSTGYSHCRHGAETENENGIKRQVAKTADEGAEAGVTRVSLSGEHPSKDGIEYAKETAGSDD